MSWSILVVDDEPMTRDLLRLMLKSVDFDVSEAGDGFDALQKVRRKRPDIMILDVMMPEVDGLVVCEILRRDPVTTDMPIIMLSAKINQEAIDAGMAAGATKYLTKPISRKELIKHLYEVLSEMTPTQYEQPVNQYRESAA